MAVNQSGNQCASLAEGATDSKYRKINQDRSNAELTTYASRHDLNDTWFGIHEAPVKTLGDGTRRSTQNYVPTPPAHLP